MDIQKFLDRMNMTRSSLANALGVDASAVTNWCNKVNTPKYSMCNRLLKMGISLDELFDEEALAMAEKMFFGKKEKSLDLTNTECAEIVKRGMLDIISK